MMSDKVELVQKQPPAWHAPGRPSKVVKMSLPYYQSNNGKYIHRVRSALNHWAGGKLSHTSVQFWCGNGGFLGDKGKLLSKVPPDGILCATCEGRAIGAGLNGSRKINGRNVMYSPKR